MQYFIVVDGFYLNSKQNKNDGVVKKCISEKYLLITPNLHNAGSE